MSIIEFHRTCILRRPAGHLGDARLPEGITFHALGRDDLPRLDAAVRALGNPSRLPRFIARYDAHGLRPYAFESDGALVAWLWLAAGVPRYLDELCWQVPMAANQAWFRDGVVLPAWRGRRVIVLLIETVVRRLGPTVEFFSDVSASNASSLRAHAAAGFVPIAQLRSVESPWLRLRSRPPAVLPTVTAIRPSQRLLWLDRGDRAWHHAHIA